MYDVYSVYEYGSYDNVYYSAPEPTEDKTKTTAEANIAMGESITLRHNNNNLCINMICDSRATEHLVKITSYLSNIFTLLNPIQIKNANLGANLEATKLGTIITKLNNRKIVKIKNILYANQLTKNLLSLKKLVQNCVDVVLSYSGIKIIDLKSNVVVKTGSFDSRFWNINFKHKPYIDNIESVECFINEEVESIIVNIVMHTNRNYQTQLMNHQL